MSRLVLRKRSISVLAISLHRELDSVRVVVRHPKHADPAFDATFSVRAFALRVKFELLRIQPRYSVQDGWTRPFPEHEVANLT